MKTIGIIGGFGPEATAQFYLKLTATTKAQIILRNVPVPKNLEHDLLIHGENLQKFIPLLTVAAKKLERDGADMIVLPCNTLHVHEQIIQNSINIPFISIIAATNNFLKQKNITKIGFLGSRVTVRENLFRKQAKGIHFVIVPTHLQRKIDVGLDLFVGTQNPAMLRDALKKSFIFFKEKHLHDVLLACTDFGSLWPSISGIRAHDTVDILVQATVNML